MIVVDASVLVPALADHGPDGAAARARLAGERLTAPEVVDLEVLSVLRRLNSRGHLSDRRAALAVRDLQELPMVRAAHRRLLSRCWQMRASVTAYDAAYVALAEAIGATLVTADARLGRASGPRCTIEVIGGGS